jgi:hypothetical protein
VSTLRVNTIQDASGGDIVNSRGIAKAWVNFNGTGTVAIRAAHNVSSITDNGTGNYTVNYTTALADTNYTTVFGNERERSTANWGFMGASLPTTSGIRIGTYNTSGSNVDYEGVGIAVFD